MFTGHHADGFEAPFGDVTSPSSTAVDGQLGLQRGDAFAG